MTGRRWGVGIGAVLAAACGQPEVNSPQDRDRATVSPPAVELFAPEVVSSADPEFATAFTPSGDTVFFNRTPPDRSRLELWLAVRAGSGWGAPVLFPPTAGLGAVDPFLSSDGTTLWVSSGAPLEGAPEGDFNLWSLSRTSEGWGAPEPLPRPVRSDSSEAFNTVADDGTLVVGSTRGGLRQVWSSRRVGERWSEPVLVPLGDSTAGASNPAIRRDGSQIVFARRSAAGDPDLWVACRTGGTWGEPIRLPEPVNSRWADFAPAFGPDHLYFTSERPGVVGPVADSIRPPGDIWRTPLGVVDDLCRG